MPISIEGDRIYFHYNCGDYNNDLKTLTQTQTPNTPLVLSQINREHPIVFRQKITRHKLPNSGAHTQKKLFCYHVGTHFCYSCIFSQTNIYL